MSMTDDPATIDHEPAERSSTRGDNVRATVFKLAVASLIVGLVMSVFGITPLGILRSLGENFEEIFRNLVSILTHAIEYLLLGATLVVPVWLAVRLLSRR